MAVPLAVVFVEVNEPVPKSMAPSFASILIDPIPALTILLLAKVNPTLDNVIAPLPLLVSMPSFNINAPF